MSVVVGRTVTRRRTEDVCDVCIVGSGASGAVLAKEFAADGRSVIVLEEGPWYSPEEKQEFKVTDTMMRLFRGQGTTVATGLGDTPVISNPLGWGAGGSSVLTGGVMFRTPEGILEEWVRDLGLEQMAPEKMAPFFDEIEADLGTEDTPECVVSEGAKRFRGGAEALGLEIKPVRRNMTGCRGASRCNFVCPIGAKNSVDRVYLPRAMDQGARLYCDALAEKLTFRGGRVSGVEGHFVGPRGKAVGKFQIAAKVVVLAMGAVHTPSFLMKNKVGNHSKQLGKRLTIHPGYRAYGVFEDEVKAGLGAMQSIYSPTLMKDGITLIAIMTPPGIMGANVPGFGAESREYMEKRRHIMAFGAMVHDTDTGSIVNPPGREPLMHYSLGDEAKAKAIEAIQHMGRIFFECGAREVLFTIPPYERVRTRDELEAMDWRAVQWKHAECGSYHPLGTVRMGTHEDTSVVDPAGRVWGVPNLYVVDGGVVPTHLGVNAQETVMSVALKLARGMREQGNRLFA